MATKNEKWLISLGFDLKAFKDSVNKTKMEADGVVASYDEMQSEIDKKVTEIINQIDKLFQNYGSSLKDAFGDKARSQIRGMTDPLDAVINKLQDLDVQVKKTGESLTDLKLEQSAETDVAFSKRGDMGSFKTLKNYTSEGGRSWAEQMGFDPEDTQKILDEWSNRCIQTINTLGDKVSKTNLKSQLIDIMGGAAEIGEEKLQSILNDIPNSVKRVTERIDNDGKVAGTTIDLMIDKYRSLKITMDRVVTDQGNVTFKRTSQNFTDTSMTKGVEDYEKALKRVAEAQQKLDDAIASNDPKASLYKYQLDYAQDFADQIKVCVTNTDNLAEAEERALQYAQTLRNVSAEQARQTTEHKNIDELNKGIEQQLKLERELSSVTAESNTHSEEYIQSLTDRLKAVEKNNESLKEQITNTEALRKAEEKLQDGRAQNQANQAEVDYQKQVKEYISLVKQLSDLQVEQKKLEKAEAKPEDLQANIDQQRKLIAAKEKYSEAVKKNTQAVKAEDDAAEKLNKTERSLNNNTNRLGSSFGSFSKKLKETLANTLAYTGAFQAIDKIGDAVFASIDKIRELDTAMTDIQMVTGYTDSQTQELIGTYAEMAQQLGVTTGTIVESASEWLLIRSYKISLNAGTSLESTRP